MTKKTPLWEDVIIIISIFTLWPTILRRETIISKVVMVFSLLLLFWILLRRITRIRDISK